MLQAGPPSHQRNANLITLTSSSLP
jgi:hypothetical protein